MIDTFVFKPAKLTLRRTRKNVLNGADARQIDLFVTDSRCDDWKLVKTEAYLGCSNAREIYCHQPSRTTLTVIGNDVHSISGNMSRLFTLAPHNLHVIQSQDELDAACNRLWDILAEVADGNRTGTFTSVEIGGVVDRAFSDFEQLLAHQKHPGTRSVARYTNESLTWGKRKQNSLQICIYDKGREYNRQSKHKLPRNRFTRVEVRLRGKKLCTAFGSDAVRELKFDQLTEIFYAEMYRFENPSAQRATKEGSVAHLLALYQAVPLKNRMVNGVDPLDAWMQAKNPQHRQVLQKQAKTFRSQCRALCLTDILPRRPDLLFTQLENLLPQA